ADHGERRGVRRRERGGSGGGGGGRGAGRAGEEARRRARPPGGGGGAGGRGALPPPIELTRADAELARFEVGTLRARGSLRSAQAVFAAAVGVDEALLDAGGEAGPGRPLPPLTQVTELGGTAGPALGGARWRRGAGGSAAP